MAPNVPLLGNLHNLIGLYSPDPALAAADWLCIYPKAKFSSTVNSFMLSISGNRLIGLFSVLFT